MILEEHISALNSEIQEHEEALRLYRERISLERQKGKPFFTNLLAEFYIPKHQELLERKRRILPQIIKTNQAINLELNALGIKIQNRQPKEVLAEFNAISAMDQDEYLQIYGSKLSHNRAKRAEMALESTITKVMATPLANDIENAQTGEFQKDEFLTLLEEVFGPGDIEYLQ